MEASLSAVLALNGRPSFHWTSTSAASPDTARLQLAELEVSFCEWDPDRGLLYLEFAQPTDAAVTTDVSQLWLDGRDYHDIFRWEWTATGRLNGVELQTRAPGPLPCLRQLTALLPPDQRPLAETSLSLTDWQTYLKNF